MNQLNIRGGLVEKKANAATDLLQTGLHTGMEATKWFIKNMAGTAAALPIAVGVPLGVMASKMTSPSAQDLKNLENTIMLAELRKAESELKREAEAVKSQQKQSMLEGTNAKEIRALV